ncbi:hypothetical protein PUN28_013356 [Cardiocondyla obscurior]|uniref:Uncharacterized protein n=1 Tax=Cardiocondyla obscurior TaxID=286306 RepID=A0AAW2F7U4_9HYME
MILVTIADTCKRLALVNRWPNSHSLKVTIIIGSLLKRPVCFRWLLRFQDVIEQMEKEQLRDKKKFDVKN